MTNPLVKQHSRACASLATERIQQQELDGEDEVNSLSQLAVAALDKMMELCGAEEGTSEERRELKRISKSIRRLVPQLQTALSTNSKKDKNDEDGDEDTMSELDLGQYAMANVFEGDTKKKSKFARLMGGAHKDHHAETVAAAATTVVEGEHTTFALSAKEQKKLDAEIEREFDAARHHHGKKGLGLK